MNMSKTINRLNLKLNPAVRERLEALQTKTEADSMVDVIRTALMVYDRLVNLEQKEQAKTMIRWPNGEEALLILPSPRD